MAKGSHVATSDGVRLYVTDDGAGPPVLFLHEYAGDYRSWSGQVAGLKDEFRCVTYSARGYLPSDVPADPASYSWQRAVQDAIEVLDALGIEQAHLIGLSMGGYTALQLGRLHPGRLRSIMAVSAGSGSEPAKRASYLEEAKVVAGQLRTRGAAAVGAQMATGPSRIQLRRRSEAAWQEFVDQLAGHSAEGLALTVLGIQASRPSLWELTDDFSRMTIPLLVVNGDEDEACLPAGLLLKRTAPACGMLVLPNSGHLPNLEDERQFNDIARWFIRSVESGAWPTRDPRSRATSTFGLDQPGTVSG